MKYNKFSRRMFLQGVGSTYLAIPFLSSLLPDKAWAQSSTAPKRYIGITNNYDYGHCRAWYPTLNELPQSLTVAGHASIRYQALRTLLGSNPRLSTVLTSGLNSHVGSLNLFRGLDIVPYFGHGFGHNLGNLAGIVTNGNLSSMPQIPTIDQLMGTNSRLNPKASEPFLMTNGEGTASYGKNSSGNVVRKGPNVNSAQAMYNTLFGGGSVPESGQSTITHPRKDVLSRVLEDFNRIRNGKQISSQDKIVLDNAFDKISEVQRNIAAETRMTNGCYYKGIPRTSNGQNYDSSTTLKNMADLTVAAMQCDLNRIFHFAGWITDSYYNKSTSEFHGGHSHPALETVAGKVNWEYMAEIQSQLVNYYLVPLLNGMSAAIDAENGKSILYNSLVHFTLEHGSVHSFSDIPTLLAGNAGGALTSGHMIDYSDRAATLADNYDIPAEGGWSINPSSSLFVGHYYGLPYNRIFNTILQAMGMAPSEYERSDINTYYRNRTDSSLGSQNNNVASIGGYGYIGAVNPLTEEYMKYGHKRYARYNYHYFKDKLPMPATSSS